MGQERRRAMARPISPSPITTTGMPCSATRAPEGPAEKPTTTGYSKGSRAFIGRRPKPYQGLTVARPRGTSRDSRVPAMRSEAARRRRRGSASGASITRGSLPALRRRPGQPLMSDSR